MSDPAKLAAAILAGPLPPEPFIAALPMYDWPEVRSQVDAQWAAIRHALREMGVDAPERLTRRNADLPPVPGGIKDGFGNVIAPDPASLPPDGFDLAVLWQHPNLLLSQTCGGPLELWLRGVRVMGQQDYSGVEGGDGEMYSSALVMRRSDAAGAVKARSEAPPSVLSDISPARGEIARVAAFPSPSTWQANAKAATQPISPLAGEMSDRTEGGASLQNLPSGLRLAFNAPDSMSGYLALQRDLEAQGSGLHIFSETIQTGGHRASIRAVAEGRADVAAIDAKTWCLAQRFEPAARELAVVGWTGKRMGLPFVTAAR
jgi:ABC-type phosphate/phosphonate transport system substrate-binding protein